MERLGDFSEQGNSLNKKERKDDTPKLRTLLLRVDDLRSKRREPRTTLKIEKELGSGSYGEVWKVRDTMGGSVLAAKIGASHGPLDNYVKECRFAEDLEEWKDLDPVGFSRFVRRHGMHLSQSPKFVLFDYAGSTNLYNLVSKVDKHGAPTKKEPLSVEVQKDVLRQIAEGLQLLKIIHAVHKDL